VAFRIEKMGLVASAADFNPGWIGSHLQAPNVVVLEDRIRIYFTTRTRDGVFFHSRPGFFDLALGDPTKIIGFSEKPCLDDGELGNFDMFGIYPASVLKIDSFFIMAYGGWTRPQDVGFDVSIGLARSSSGDHFVRDFPGPVLGKTMEEPFIQSSPKLRFYEGLFRIFYISGKSWVESPQRQEPSYRIRASCSEDLVSWTRHGKDLIPALTPNESQASPDVFFFQGKYHMLFCFRGANDYLGGRGSYRIGYASSYDLVAWVRDDEKVNFPVGPDSWDSEMVAYPSVFQVGLSWFVAYVGNGVGETGIGIARLEVQRDVV